MSSERNSAPRAGAACALLLLLGGIPAARAQQNVPPIQDQLILQERSNVVQGSGARAFGMGGAFLARDDDATAASWNPAGLSYLRSPEVSVVWSGGSLNSTQRFPDGSPQSDRRNGGAPDFVAATYPFGIGSVTGAAQLSFQRVISFSYHRTFSNLSGAAFDVDSTGGFDVLALASGLQVSRRLRVGATLNRWTDGYHQSLDKLSPRSESRQWTEFDLSGWNVNLGAIWSPVESLNVGAVAKTSFSGKVNLHRARLDFGSNSTITTNEFPRGAGLQGLAGVTLDFPGAVGLGTSWRPTSPLTVSVDFTRTFWSRGRIHNFFALPASEPGAPPAVPMAPDNVFDSLPYPTLNDSSQRDTTQLRGGVEYVLIRNRIRWPLRAGVFSDGQYFRAGDGRAPRFSGFTAGTGVNLGSVLLDVAYVYETGQYTDFAGVQNSVSSQRVFASVIYRHAGRR